MKWISAACLLVVACNDPTHQGRYLSSWIRDLDSDQDYKRRQACEAIGEIGPAAAAAIPDLIELLDDLNPGVQEFAREALTQMGPRAIAHLEPLLDHQTPSLRLHATIATIQLDSGHAAAQGELVRFVTSLGNVDLAKAARAQAVRTGTPMVAMLLPHLKDSYAPVRLQVLETLRAMGPQANAAVPLLIPMTASETKPELRRAVVLTLAKVGTREQVEPVLRNLSADDSLAVVANDMLVFMGAVDRPTQGAVEEAAAPPPPPELEEEPLRSLLSE